VPVTVVLALLLNRSALRATHPAPSSAPTAPASSGPARSSAALPAVSVPAPPASAGASRSCPRLLAAVPLTLADLPARPVDSASPFVAAWGEPAVLLRCGVSRPRGFVVGVQTIVVNGVTWYPEPTGNRTVWTAVDRPVYVELSVPTGYASAPVAALSTEIARTLAITPVRPGAG
jgi:hypothetical protein